YPYLDDYGCDFYDGYYVRFGYYRSSYYVACSGYGPHADPNHHSHFYPCRTHGGHYYHLRDCPECFPSAGSYVYHDVEVPDAPVIYDKVPESGASAEAREIAPEAAAMDREEAFYASLKPAQLSFVLGLIDFKGGSYEQANESFYNSSLEDPNSKIV